MKRSPLILQVVFFFHNEKLGGAWDRS